MRGSAARACEGAVRPNRLLREFRRDFSPADFLADRHRSLLRARGADVYHHIGVQTDNARGVRSRTLCTLEPHGLPRRRSEEHTSELQSLMRISYAVFCLKKKKHTQPVAAHTTSTTLLKTHNHSHKQSRMLNTIQ